MSRYKFNWLTNCACASVRLLLFERFFLKHLEAIHARMLIVIATNELLLLLCRCCSVVSTAKFDTYRIRNLFCHWFYTKNKKFILSLRFKFNPWNYSIWCDLQVVVWVFVYIKFMYKIIMMRTHKHTSNHVFSRINITGANFFFLFPKPKSKKNYTVFDLTSQAGARYTHTCTRRWSSPIQPQRSHWKYNNCSYRSQKNEKNVTCFKPVLAVFYLRQTVKWMNSITIHTKWQYSTTFFYWNCKKEEDSKSDSFWIEEIFRILIEIIADFI